MIFKNRLYFAQLLVVGLLCFGCKKDDNMPEPPTPPQDAHAYYTQGSSNRTAAEWEPALGAMVSYPLAVPHQLVVEIANDYHLYTLVENDSAKMEAETWFSTWGIAPNNVTFITVPQAYATQWTRDWGPTAVFDSNKQYFIADGRYPYGSPTSKRPCESTIELEIDFDTGGTLFTETEDNSSVPVANQLGYNVLALPFINTGGNLYTDGVGSAFSTCIMYKENEHHGVSRSSLLEMSESLSGYKNYHITSNFEADGIQHIDCFMKVLNEETLLVAEPPMGHALHSVYENIVTQELANLKTIYDRPFNILRIKTDVYDGEELAAYTNSLILNKTIYVPLFDIPQDAEALETFRNAMPGYTVKGFTFRISEEPYDTEYLMEIYGDYGWNGGDALHCRTRAIWDPEMLFISSKNIPATVSAEDRNTVYTTIIDYSGSDINKAECQLFWRVKGSSDWNRITLSEAETDNHFFAEIPSNDSGTTIEYYISAVSNSGKTETKPRTAPEGSFEFTIQ